MPYLLNGPLTVGFVVVGTCLNALTVFVLSRHNFVRQMSRKSYRSSVRRSDSSTNGSVNSKPRIYIYLMWLSFADTILLISALLMYSLPALMNGTLGYYIHFFPFYYLLSNTSLTASVWLMCALMIDRYRTLCSPLTARRLSFKTIHRILFLICFAALCFSIPRYFELELRLDEYDQYYLSQTLLVHNQIYMIGYRIVGGLMFYSLLPYFVLFSMSLRVWFVLRRAAKARLKMAAQQNVSGCTDSEMILLAVMAKFLCSRLMPTALDVAEHAIGSDRFLESSEATLCVDISNLIVVASSSMNFLIFYFFSSTFRQKLWRQNSRLSELMISGIHQKLQPQSSIIRRSMRSQSSTSARIISRKDYREQAKPSIILKTTVNPIQVPKNVECICYNV
uniref:G-protein coupled receptors family 1 profile domain-containing protein n=1 Tax=Panagrolaimus sp. JU765 TaxID=591449 RepID=A0AC34RII3_9BILA